MLVLTRKTDEQILIGDNIKVTLVRVRGNSVRIGIEAPRDVRIVRGELERFDEQKDHDEFVLSDRELPFAHPQPKPDVFKTASKAPKIFVGRVRRADDESTRACRAPLAGFMSAS